MSFVLKTVNKKTLDSLNKQLGNLIQLHEEICKAQSAGVPDLEGQKQQCQDLADYIKRFKAVYFSTEI